MFWEYLGQNWDKLAWEFLPFVFMITIMSFVSGMQRASRLVISSIIFALVFFVSARVWLGNKYGMDGINLDQFALSSQGLAVKPIRVNAALPELNSDMRVVEIDGQPVEAWVEKLFFDPIHFSNIEKNASLTYKIIPDDAKPGSAPFLINVPLRTTSEIIQNFDLTGRWSNPLMMVAFLGIGLWVYAQRPYESSAMALLVLGVCAAIYQIFQPFLRQISDITQPLVFWYDTFFAMIFGVTIFGSLIHIGLVFPSSIAHTLNIKGKTLPTWKLITFVYLGLHGLFWVLQAPVFLSAMNPAQKILQLQKNWQFVQIVGFVGAMLMGLWHLKFGSKQDHKDIRAVVLTATSIVIFLLFTEKVFLFNQLSPLFDDNLRRAASIAFPVVMAVQIQTRHIFRIEGLISRLAVNIFALVFICLIELGVFFVIAKLIDWPLDDMSIIMAAALSFGIVALLEGVLRKPVEKLLMGNRPAAPQLINAIEQSFDLNLPAETSIQNATAAITKTLKLEKAEIKITELGESEKEKPAVRNLMDLKTEIPLLFQGQELGQLRLTFLPGRVLHLNHELRETISHQLGAMLYAARISANLRQAQKKTQAIEKKQQSLRQQLHDGLGAEMGGMVLSIDATKKFIERGKLTQASDILDAIKSTSVKMSEEVRAMARTEQGQTPTELAQLGLEKSLSSFLSSFAQRMEIVFDPRLPAKRLVPEIETALYFITREAVNNAARHSNATQCVIVIDAAEGKTVKLSVADNGNGFIETNSDGSGIKFMRQRALDLGGTFDILPNRPSGAIIQVVIPIADAVGD